jgi:hypothetical protein
VSCGEGAAQRGDHREDASEWCSLLSKGTDGHGQAQHAADECRRRVAWRHFVGAAGLGVFCMVDGLLVTSMMISFVKWVDRWDSLRTPELITLEEFENSVISEKQRYDSSNLVTMFPPAVPGCNPVSATFSDGCTGGVAVKAPELAKTATTDKGLLPLACEVMRFRRRQNSCCFLQVRHVPSEVYRVTRRED